LPDFCLTDPKNQAALKSQAQLGSTKKSQKIQRPSAEIEKTDQNPTESKQNL